MTEEEKAKEHQIQTDDLYRSFGKFVVKFELLVFAMRNGIIFTLSSNGLKDQQLSNVIVADLTAFPMKSILEAMIYQISELNDEDRRIIKNIFGRIQKLIEARNDIVHGTHFVGYASLEQTEFDVASGHKLTRGKKGSGSKSFSHKSTDLDELSKECDIVIELVNRLWTVIMSKRPISNNFVLTNDGDILTPQESEKLDK